MQRILLFLAVVFGSLTFMSAQSAPDISRTIESVNSSCPRQAGPGLTLTSVSLTPQGVVMEFEINEQNLSVDTLAGQKDMLHDMYVSEVTSSSDTAMQALRKYCIGASLPLKFHFVGNITDDSFDIILPPDDLK